MKEILLPKGYVALVDDEDYERVAAYKWWAMKLKHRIYVSGEINGQKKLLHRFVLEYDGAGDVDHIDGDRLNNQRANLRVATRAQNLWNQGPRGGRKYKGVYLHKPGVWRARIMCHGKRIDLGSHRSEEAAARAVDVALREHHGQFARLNFPEVRP